MVSIELTSPIRAEALDVDGAIVASMGGELAAGLMLAATLVIVIAALAALTIRFQAFRRTKKNLSTAAVSRLPWDAVVAAGGAVAIIGGAVGLWSSLSSDSIMGGAGLSATLASPFGINSLSAMLFGAFCIVFYFQRRAIRRVPFSAALIVAFAASGIFVTASSVPDIQRPQRSVEALVSVNSLVQGAVAVVPGAAGSNEVRIGLTGSDQDVEALRRAIETGDATVSMRSLGLGLESNSVTLRPDGDGGFVASNVIAEADGRWRVQFNLAANLDTVIADVTLQPNPAVTR